MAIAAAIVVAVSMLAERVKPFLAAMVATLPVSAGPSLVFLSLDHDDAFMRATLIGAMVANLAICSFVITYAGLAQKHGTLLSLGAAFALWVATGALLKPLAWTLPLALAANALVYAAMIPLVAPFTRAPRPAVPPRSRWALPARAAGVSVLVALITLLSAHLGPYISAFLAVFPIVLSSLVIILHPRIGGPATAAFIASTVSGLAGFGTALACAAASMEWVGRYWALLIGLGVSLLWNGALALWRHRRSA